MFGVVLHGASVSAAGPAFVKGPYLQALTGTTVEVRVQLDAPGPVSVDVGEPGGATRAVTDGALSGFHVVRVGDLAPATRYEYVVHAGAATSERGSFVTAPRDDSAAPFTFLLYGDNRSGDDVHRLVTRALLGTPSDFLLHTGDFAYAGGDEREWQTLFDIEHALLRDRCLFSSVGNHELNGDPGAAAYERYLGPAEGKLYATFRFGSARFFLLNAFTSWSGGEEREWLARELASADSEAGLAWRFVVIHHGPFSSGRHGPNERIDDAKIPELLGQHKVDLVISGHDHIYERGEATSSGYDLRYVISGGAGAPLYAEHSPRPYSRRFEPVYHFVEVGVTRDAVTVIARRPDGSAIEKCAFGHAPGWDCDGAARSPSTPSAPSSTAPTRAAPVANPSPGAASSRCGCKVAGAGGGGAAALAIALALVALRAGRRRAF
jgi:hypothetical protein